MRKPNGYGCKCRHWCRLDACKTQYKRLIYTISWHWWSYPDVASTRVKHNTNIEFIPSLGIDDRTLMSPRCVQNAIQTMNLYHLSASMIVPWCRLLGSMIVPWCRLEACKTQYKRWVCRNYGTPVHSARFEASIISALLTPLVHYVNLRCRMCTSCVTYRSTIWVPLNGSRPKTC